MLRATGEPAACNYVTLLRALWWLAAGSLTAAPRLQQGGLSELRTLDQRLTSQWPGHPSTRTIHEAVAAAYRRITGFGFTRLGIKVPAIRRSSSNSGQSTMRLLVA